MSWHDHTRVQFNFSSILEETMMQCNGSSSRRKIGILPGAKSNKIRRVKLFDVRQISSVEVHSSDKHCCACKIASVFCGTDTPVCACILLVQSGTGKSACATKSIHQLNPLHLSSDASDKRISRNQQHQIWNSKRLGIDLYRILFEFTIGI